MRAARATDKQTTLSYPQWRPRHLPDPLPLGKRCEPTVRDRIRAVDVARKLVVYTPTVSASSSRFTARISASSKLLIRLVMPMSKHSPVGAEVEPPATAH